MDHAHAPTPAERPEPSEPKDGSAPKPADAVVAVETKQSPKVCGGATKLKEVNRSDSSSRPDDRSSSSSRSSGSCSSSSAEQSLDEATLEPLATSKVTHDADRQVSLAADSAAAKPAGPSRPQEATAGAAPEPDGRLKLALSLENVSDQQEVLRDPSKRITSDNKEREKSLIAQYEKLNITALTSSSSLEEEQNAAAV